MEILNDLGNGLKIAKVDINKELREQDLNARIMGKQAFSQLVKNIKRRGGLESLPYCALKDGSVEIVSGHHRVRACREAGITEIPILLDTNEMTRSQIVAKQLAHNSLVGTDDKDILRQLYNEMDSIDDKLEAFIDIDELKPEKLDEGEILKLAETPHFKTMSFIFTDKEYDDVDKILDRLEEEGAKDARVCDMKDFEPLVKKLEASKKLNKVKNAAVAMDLLVLSEYAKMTEKKEG